jgi:glycosyltransferase involved in cell wall biosynthesis
MPHHKRPVVGYVVSRYPRYSETFIVNEILDHERAGLDLEIFALRPSIDTHFQDLISQVRAPVNYVYLPGEGLTPEQLTGALLSAGVFWNVLQEASAVVPGLWQSLETARGEEIREVYQAVVLARLVRQKDIRHLHAHFAGRPTTVAMLAAHFAGIPYTFTAHANDIFNASVRHDDLKRKLAEAAAVVTVSDYNVEYLRAAFGGAAARVQRTYCGLDLLRFPYESPRDRPPRIIAVGRLVEKKGLADLVEACAILERRGCSFSCQIIGSGILETALRTQIARLGLERHVVLAGPRPQKDVIQSVQSAAALALPCAVGEDGDRDGLPTVLLEAMALGTPCVSTDLPGISEAVRDGETGLTVPQRDAAALATALDRLLSGEALRVRLAAKARRLVEDEFDVRSNAASLRALFLAAIDTAERRHRGLADLPATVSV